MCAPCFQHWLLSVTSSSSGLLSNALVHALVPGLKGIERATVKTSEKYSGLFDRLTDLARMTFVCIALR